MSTSEVINAALIGALFAALVAGILALLQYLITKSAESDKWKRERRAKEIDTINSVVAKLAEHLAFLHADAHVYVSKSTNEARRDVLASFVEWEILIHPHCNTEERERIQENLNELLEQKYIASDKITVTVVEVTNLVVARIIRTNRSWWQFWN